MKHFLIPVDFSDYALNACLFTARLAANAGAKMTVFHTYHIPIIDPLMPAEYLSDLAATAEKDVNANMEKLLGQIREYAAAHHLRAVETASKVTMGFAADEITLAAEKLEPDFVVMGRRYTAEMNKILVGSVTTRILEKAKAPVLIVPENIAPDFVIKDILYASEFADDDKNALTKLIALAKLLGAKVHCVHVAESSDGNSAENMKSLENSFTHEQKNGTIAFHTIHAADVEEGLLNFAENNHIGLMAMLTHRRTFFQKIFDSSLTKKVAFKTNIPLAVFHTK